MTTKRSAARSAHPSSRGARRHHLPGESPADVAPPFDDNDIVLRRPPSGPRDPFLTRLGVLVLIGLLLAPVVAALGNDNANLVTSQAGGAMAMAGPIMASPSDVALPRAGDAPSTSNSTGVAGTPSTTVPHTWTASAPRSASVSAQSRTSKRSCVRRYRIRPGDFWIGIADRAGIELRALLRANNATVKTYLYPGGRLCLPQGARKPGPPPTIPPAPAERPKTTASAPKSKPAAPATTTPPAPRPPSSYTRDEVLAIIREVWPDDLEERAIQIAWRESNWIPTARNSCCHGLFQIYFTVHRSWLGWFGVTSAEGLWDPRTNAMAAYYLYTRAGGWGPWGG